MTDSTEAQIEEVQRLTAALLLAAENLQQETHASDASMLLGLMYTLAIREVAHGGITDAEGLAHILGGCVDQTLAKVAHLTSGNSR